MLLLFHFYISTDQTRAYGINRPSMALHYWPAPSPLRPSQPPARRNKHMEHYGRLYHYSLSRLRGFWVHTNNLFTRTTSAISQKSFPAANQEEQQMNQQYISLVVRFKKSINSSGKRGCRPSPPSKESTSVKDYITGYATTHFCCFCFSASLILHYSIRLRVVSLAIKLHSSGRGYHSLTPDGNNMNK